MKPFSYERAASPAEAAAAVARMPGARFVAGGTNLLDLMKLHLQVQRILSLCTANNFRQSLSI